MHRSTPAQRQRGAKGCAELVQPEVAVVEACTFGNGLQAVEEIQLGVAAGSGKHKALRKDRSSGTRRSKIAAKLIAERVERVPLMPLALRFQCPTRQNGFARTNM